MFYSVVHFEIDQIEVFVYIFLSNLNNLHTQNGYLAVSESESRDGDDMSKLCIPAAIGW